MKAVTIRGVEPEVTEKLKMVAKKQGKSVNRVILELIKTSLGVKKEKKFSRKYDDLDDLFGRWERVFNTGAENSRTGRQMRKTTGSKVRVTEKPQKLL